MTGNLSEIANELNRESRLKDMPRLIFITDNEAQSCPEEIIEKLPSGSMVIFRDYHLENRAELGIALRYISRARKIKFFVAGDLTLALLLEADGLHLPEYMLSHAENIKKDNPSLLVSVAAHNEATVKAADKLNLYAALLSPIFPTESHPETLKENKNTLGVLKLNQVCSRYKIPVYALGGVNKTTAKKLLSSRIAGFAAIRGI